MWRKNKANNSSTRNIGKCESNDVIVIIIRLLITERIIIRTTGIRNINSNSNINDLKDEHNDRLEMKETLTWTRKCFGKYTNKNLLLMVISTIQNTI